MLPSMHYFLPAFTTVTLLPCGWSSCDKIRSCTDAALSLLRLIFPGCCLSVDIFGVCHDRVILLCFCFFRGNHLQLLRYLLCTCESYSPGRSKGLRAAYHVHCHLTCLRWSDLSATRHLMHQTGNFVSSCCQKCVETFSLFLHLVKFVPFIPDIRSWSQVLLSLFLFRHNIFLVYK